MTGFGAGHGIADEVIAVEVRSVNHKFCEVKARLPRELASFEAEVVRMVKSRIARGAIEVSVRREAEVGSVEARLDLPLARAYVDGLRHLARELKLPEEIQLTDLAQIEGVLRVAPCPPDPQAAAQALTQALGAALVELEAMRIREGSSLKADLALRVRLIESAADEVRAFVPKVIAAYRDRLSSRVTELAQGATVDAGRLAQEVAIFAEKSDIAEELTRLASHLAQFRAELDGDGPIGRRLDFLTQELNREINTLGSKSQSFDIATRVVTMKAELERIREQVQNVE